MYTYTTDKGDTVYSNQESFMLGERIFDLDEINYICNKKSKYFLMESPSTFRIVYKIVPSGKCSDCPVRVKCRQEDLTEL